MSDEDLKDTVEALHSFRDELCSSPQKALDYLVMAGILTPEGKLIDTYGQTT